MFVGGLEATVDNAFVATGDTSGALASLPSGPLDVVDGRPRDASGAARGQAPSITGASAPAALPVASSRPAGPRLQLLTVDVIACAVAAICAFLLRFGIDHHAHSSTDLVVAVLLPLAWAGAAARHGAYDSRFAGIGTVEFARTFRAFLDLTVAAALISYAAHLELARGFLLAALPLTLALSWTGRYLARLQLHRLRRVGEAMNRVVAVGSAGSVFALARAMERDVHAGLHVVGACLPVDAVDDIAAVRLLEDIGIPVLGTADDVRASIASCGARSVAVVAGDIGPQAVRAIAWGIEGSGVDLIVSSGLTEVAERRVHVQTVAGQPLLRVDEPTFSGARGVVKGCFDRSSAAVALVVLSPLLAGLALLVRCTSPGPAFYLQERIGRNGVPFRIVKFRSMHTGADAQVEALTALNEAADGLLFKIQDDPRITRVGRVLRRFSLDELPQLWNVLCGSMSLVGPRPPLASEVERYGLDVRRRLLVKPGLTGVWQVSGRSDLSWEESVRLDLHYVENWTFALDIVVLLKTMKVVVRATGAY